MTRLPNNLDDGALRQVRRDASATDAAMATASNRRSWPVLARIGDAASSEQRAARSESAATASPRTFRVDAPHVTVDNSASQAQRAGATSLDTDKKKQKNTSDSASRQPARYLHRLPTVLRFAIRTYFMLSPYRSLIRAAMMFVLMALTGASTMFMVGSSLQTEKTPSPGPTSAAIAPATPADATTNPAPLEPAIQTASPSESPTSQESPTALGPTSSGSRELVAIEPNNEAPRVKEFTVEPAPITAKPIAVTAIPRYPTTSVAAMPYPTTPYPAIHFPENGSTVPRVQTSDPPAVAKFEGTLQSIPPR